MSQAMCVFFNSPDEIKQSILKPVAHAISDDLLKQTPETDAAAILYLKNLMQKHYRQHRSVYDQLKKLKACNFT